MYNKISTEKTKIMQIVEEELPIYKPWTMWNVSPTLALL